jgi:thiamine-phosphate pyrophosphorylase
MTPTREAPRLCLVFEPKPDSGALARLEKALAAASPASLVLTPGAGLELDVNIAKLLISAAHKRGVAVLIESDARAARDLGADGVHLSWSRDPLAAYVAAREILGADRIVGVDAGRSRHDAMSLGEAGADYVGFGIPSHVTDRETAIARRHDLVAWWAEIFEVPVVAFDVDTTEEARQLASAGADFIAARVPGELPEADVVPCLQEFAAALDKPEAVT